MKTQLMATEVSLEDAIANMSECLEHHGFAIEQLNWLNPLPSVWSVQLRDEHCPTLFSIGKGTSRQGALASALNEFIKRLSCNYFFSDYYLGQQLAEQPFVHHPSERWFSFTGDKLPEGLLDEETLQHYDMEGELTAAMLVDTNSGLASRGICALPFTRQREQLTVWFPVNIIGNLCVNNGMGAGSNPYEARVQALSEIFERHIKNTILSAGISLPEIPAAVLAEHPQMLAVIEQLREQGFVVYVRDASLGGKFPLVNVTLINPRNGGCFAAFGAHPVFAVALERAVTELLQGRMLDQLDQFQPLNFDLQLVAEPHNLETHFIDSSGLVGWDLLSKQADYPFTQWNVEGDAKAQFEHLCELIHRVDMDIYIADYRHLGYDCCRIIVPGMSEVYPVEELVWNNNNVALALREPILAIGKSSNSQLQQLLAKLEPFDDQQLVASLIGIIPGDSGWRGLRLGELKLLICLAIEDLATAQEWLEWLLLFEQPSGERARLYPCLHQLLNFAVSDDRPFANYRYVLADIYGEQLLQRAEQMLAGQGVFASLGCHDLSLDGLLAHGQLLSAYSKLQLAKTEEAN